MSKIALSGNASGTGTLTIAAPNTSTDRTLTLPDNTGTLVSTGSTAGVTQAMLASGVAGNGPAFSAYSATNQSISAAVPTKVVCGTEEFDTNSNFDTSTSRFTPTVAGYYQCTGSVESSAAGTDTYFIAMLYKNGSKIASGTNYPTNVSAGPNALVTSLIYCNGSTDYVEFYGQRQSASTFYAGVGTKFQAVMVRAA